MVLPIDRRAAVLAVAFAATCARASAASPAKPAAPVLHVVGAENFYADVVRQLGGAHVAVTAILSNPNTDPHAYESSTVDAAAVANADLIVENGAGYDAFVDKLAAASPQPRRTTIVAATLAHRKAGDNPHVWFAPGTMALVATHVEAELERRDRPNARDYRANLRAFVVSLRPWTARIASLRARFARAPVAVTEPVFNDTIAAAGLDVRTPPSFQLAVEEGNDPAPQDVRAMRELVAGGAVRAFVYNVQTVEPSTSKLLTLARASHVPVVGVYETMPAGQTYQSWMLAEIAALDAALAHGTSTESLR